MSEKSLKWLIERIDTGTLVLPEIQRDFVWKRDNVRQLFDSLYRKLPIGYMLIWKARYSVAPKEFKSVRRAQIGQRLHDFYGYLLDGQQRLTSIRLVRDRHEDFPLLFSLKPVNNNDPDQDRFVYGKYGKDKPWYVPVSDIISETCNPWELAQNLQSSEGIDSKLAKSIHDDLNRLKDVLNYLVGIIEFEHDDIRTATQLFIRFNSTGRKLSRSDLVAAELALTAEELISKKISRLSTAYSPRFNFTKTFLIQCLVANLTDKIDPKRTDVWGEFTDKQIRRSWNKTKVGVDKCIKFITGTMKWDSDSWLPSVNALIPLIYILSHRNVSDSQLQLAKKWLNQACIHSLFSGSVHSELDRILKGLSKETSVKRLHALTRRQIGKIEPGHFVTGRRCGPAMSLFITMLRTVNAKDWVSHDPLDGTVIGHNAELQIHHFFPRQCLTKHGINDLDLINTFANYTVISKDTNLKFLDLEPIDYIKKNNIKRKDLEAQFIPLDEDLWRVKNYRKFLRVRRENLSKAANKLLG
jgi:hypothetical protein